MKATVDNLMRLRQYIDETNATNSNNDKLAVLEKYKNDDFIRKVLHYTYNDLLQFRVTSDNLKKNKDIYGTTDAYGSDLFRLLDDLHNSVITGHNAIGYVNTFIRDHRMYADILYKIIDRNLETRVTGTLINKVIPDLIPEFKVALCESYDDIPDKKKPNFEKELWLCSQKLDGCRGIAVIGANGGSTIYSRSGKEFQTLQVIKDEIVRLGIKNVVLDGEICMIDENGADDFTAIMKEITRKDHTIKNPRFKVFDILTHDEFFSKTSTTLLHDRLQRLDLYSPIIQLLQQDAIVSQEAFQARRDYAASKGWEGLIIRKNAPYQGKRSKDILKVKNFYDAEYVVKDVIMETIRNLDKTTGLEVAEEMLSAVIVEHKGFDVKVGSGFSIEQRKAFHKDPSLIIGKTITVKYFSESSNENGGLSLRFPTIKTIYETERTT